MSFGFAQDLRPALGAFGYAEGLTLKYEGWGALGRGLGASSASVLVASDTIASSEHRQECLCHLRLRYVILFRLAPLTHQPWTWL
jgi:hypothetical protein